MPAQSDPRFDAQPETAAALAQMKEVAWTATDPELLELCRVRMALMLASGEDLKEPAPETLSDRELAFLAFTEQFVLSVASVSDSEVNALLAYAEPVDVYSFVAALYSLEMTLRIEMASRVLLAPEEAAA